jgi:hypothetical protein
MIDYRPGLLVLLQMTLRVSGGVFVVTGAYVYIEVCFTECRGIGRYVIVCTWFILESPTGRYTPKSFLIVCLLVGAYSACA